MRTFLLRVILTVIACVVLAVGVLAAPAGAGVADSGWSRVRSPNPFARTGTLGWVSCPRVSMCMAVGAYVDRSGAGVTLAERWDGARWRRLPIPNPRGAAATYLSGLSCPSSSACMAVGGYTARSSPSGPHTRPFAERWNGARWRIESAAQPSGTQSVGLNQVSCPSRSVCIAVGQALSSTGATAPLAERWNGRRWRVQPTPNPSPGGFVALSDLSCTSSSACTAVGQSIGGNSVATLVERWDGARWSIQASPAVGALLGVACTASSACTAVGFTIDGTTLAERWNGSRWSIQATPNPSVGGPQLNAVSCTSSSACTAVGGSLRRGDSAAGATTLAERWNGRRWRIQPTPTPRKGGVLQSVACPRASACAAVGSGSESWNTPSTYPLAQRWNGTRWRRQRTAKPPGSRSAQLIAVSCASRTSCMSVGQSGGTLAERWNQTAWRITHTPSPVGSAASDLNGVSCTSPSACIAVGTAYDRSFNPIGTVTERWNGSRWRIQPTPTSQSGGASLDAVSCTSANACIAVGSTGCCPAAAPLAEWWNGTAWRIMPGAAGSAGAVLLGVSCTSPSACTAVGTVLDDMGQATGSITERWDGTTWTIQPTPTSGSAGAVLRAVSCPVADACTAVGNTATALLAEQWTGTTWTLQTTPTPPGTQIDGFTGVSCPTPSACTAVGFDFLAPLTIAERWDGSRWRVQNPPNLPGASELDPPAVSCPVPSVCTAVGGFANTAQTVTLAEQWNRRAGSAPAAGSTPPPAGPSLKSCTPPSAAHPTPPAPRLSMPATHARPTGLWTPKPPDMC